jgi:ABC-type glycerol-3-phosphate transport system substrate-binding protein
MQKQGFSRREFLSLAGATGGVALLAACQAVAPAAESGGTEASMEPVNVSVQSGWYTSGDRDIWTPSIELFHENVPNITVELVRLHVTPEDTMTAIAGGTAPDIYHRYIGGFSELMARGVMYPLDDLLATVKDFDRDIYLGPQWEGGMWDGVTFGVPCLEGGAMPAICWHKNIIDEIGGDPEVGPRTWGEMLDWARKINQYDDDGNLTRAGFDPRDSFGITIIGQPVIFDENYISGDKRTFNFDSATYAEGLEILAQFWIDAGTPQMNAFAGEWGYWSGYPSSGFNSGKRAMVTDGNWLPGMIRDMEEVTGVLMEDIGYGFHPNLNEGLKAVDFGTGHTLFMPRNTEVAEDAIKFMIHMTSVEVGLLEFEIRAAAMWSKPILDKVDLSSVPGLQWFFDAPLEADRLWSPSEFLTPVQSQVENLWQRAIEETIVGAKSAEDSLFDINSELQQSLDEYWETQG